MVKIFLPDIFIFKYVEFAKSLGLLIIIVLILISINVVTFFPWARHWTNAFRCTFTSHWVKRYFYFQFIVKESDTQRDHFPSHRKNKWMLANWCQNSHTLTFALITVFSNNNNTIYNTMIPLLEIVYTKSTLYKTMSTHFYLWSMRSCVLRYWVLGKV